MLVLNANPTIKTSAHYAPGKEAEKKTTCKRKDNNMLEDNLLSVKRKTF
jgi:hypothetical protein